MKQFIIVNFKTYAETKAEKGLDVAKMCERVAEHTNAHIAIAPALIDLSLIRKAVSIPVFSQHLDTAGDGAHTGHITAGHIKSAGANGALINHSERPVPATHIQKAVHLCKEYRLVSVVCVPSPDAIRKVLDVCRPDYIAYEPPELIGGNVSVTSAKPDVVRKAVEIIKVRDEHVKVLCGAGIKTGKDVSTALKLGCKGVLVGSGVLSAEDPEKALTELAMAR